MGTRSLSACYQGDLSWKPDWQPFEVDLFECIEGLDDQRETYRISFAIRD